MLRPLLAFVTLCLAAFLLAPTVASVHQRVTALHMDRDLPWQIWKWNDPPATPDCEQQRQLYTEVTQWPSTIRKDSTFTLRGVVQSEEDGRAGVAGIDVEVFMNATKESPGVLLGKAESQPGGSWWMNVRVPFDAPADHYHIVSHAKEKRIQCTHYREAWSDPEVDVYAETAIEWTPIDDAVVGRPGAFGGVLVDEVGAPVANANVTVSVFGRSEVAMTDSRGRFSIEHTPVEPGEVRMFATFNGSTHYKSMRDQTMFSVAAEDFEFEGGSTTLAFVRSTPLRVAGHVYVAPGVRGPDVTLHFEGTRVATCPTCPASGLVRVPVDASGAFAIDLVVPRREAPGEATVTIGGGGLKETYTARATVEVPTQLTLETGNGGLFARTFHGTARLTDETGAPYAGLITFETPAGRIQNGTNDLGVATFAAGAPCGPGSVQASFAGSRHVRPATAQSDVLVCGYLAFIPPWLAVIPWWVWPLALVVGLAAWRITRSLTQTYATVIRLGPPLTLTFTEPSDDAAGYAALGEAVVATAALDAPLPEGHTLRMGTARATAPEALDADLRAHLRIVPSKLGTVPIRAEIVDTKGRVITRRTVTLHVVRYAEEIEARYLKLRTRTGATEAVTPREFEAWLHARAPELDPATIAHLVRVFEEADYSPRVAGRADFSAYLAAERLHLDALRPAQEVRARAPVA